MPSKENAPFWVPLGENPDLARLFSTMDIRTVANDHTVSFAGTTYKILRQPADKSLSGRKVAVHITPEGELHFYDEHNHLEHKACAPTITVREKTAQPVVPEVYDIVCVFH